MLVFAVEPKFRKNGLVYPKTARAISGSTVENLAIAITFRMIPILFSYLSCGIEVIIGDIVTKSRGDITIRLQSEIFISLEFVAKKYAIW